MRLIYDLVVLLLLLFFFLSIASLLLQMTMMRQAHDGDQDSVQDDVSKVKLENVSLERKSAGDHVGERAQFAFLGNDDVVVRESKSVEGDTCDHQHEGSGDRAIHNSTEAHES